MPTATLRVTALGRRAAAATVRVPALRRPAAATLRVAAFRRLASAVALVRVLGDRGAPLDLTFERLVLPRHRRALHQLAGELLDAAQQVVLLRRSEARSAPAGLGPRRPADAVHVVLPDVRQREVHPVPPLRHVASPPTAP